MSSSIHTINPQARNYRSCQACLDTDEPGTFLALPCNHYWCHECLSRVCSGVRTESDVPIRCDDNCNIPLELALRALPQAESRRLQCKLRELETPTRERFYCANCSEFIPPVFQVIDVFADCVKCGFSTCKLCRGLDHEGDCTSRTKADQQTFDLMEKEYQKCSKCRTVVERTQGCPHMTCICGYEFCYHCGGPIRSRNGCGHLEPGDTRQTLLMTAIESTVEGPWARLEEVLLLGPLICMNILLWIYNVN